MDLGWINSIKSCTQTADLSGVEHEESAFLIETDE